MQPQSIHPTQTPGEPLINRMKTEFEAMSSRRRMVYGVALGLAVIVAALLLTGVWDPMAVDTGVTPVK